MSTHLCDEQIRRLLGRKLGTETRTRLVYPGTVQIPHTSFRYYPVDGIGKKPPKPPSGLERSPNFASRLYQSKR